MKRFRSHCIDQIAGLMNFVDKISYANPDHPIGWRDHLRWWLKGLLSTVFDWLWSGSDEEIEAVYESEVPLDAMSQRQRAVLRFPRYEYAAHCIYCDWRGFWDECHGDHECPHCGEGIYLDPLERALL